MSPFSSRQLLDIEIPSDSIRAKAIAAIDRASSSGTVRTRETRSTLNQAQPL